MLTKTEYCEAFVENYLMHRGPHNKKIEDIKEEEIFASTSLGICLEFLGKIPSEEIRGYIAERSGTVINYINGGKYKFLSMRELISLLPDD